MGKRSRGSKNDRHPAGETEIVHESDVLAWCREHALTIAGHLMHEILCVGGNRCESLDSLVRSFAGRRVGVLRAIAMLEKRGWISVTRRADDEPWEFRSRVVAAATAHELN